jgi:hypothetical protein
MAEAISLKHLARHVADPRLRQLLTPDYPIGCRRVLIADDYYPALQRANVELVTAPIKRLTEDGIVAGGAARPVDVVIHAAGFETTRFLAPMTIVGRSDMPVSLAWRQGAEAYYGMAVPGYPKFLPDVRAQHQSRPQLHHLHDRMPGGFHPAVSAPAPGRRLAASRSGRGDGALSGAARARDRRHGLGGGLPELVQDQGRQGHQPLVGLYAAILVAHAAAKAGRLSRGMRSTLSAATMGW